MIENPLHPHLTTEEVELWAQGLLGAARTIHLADCPTCLEGTERERKLLRDLAQLLRFGPEFGFVDRATSGGKH